MKRRRKNVGAKLTAALLLAALPAGLGGCGSGGDNISQGMLQIEALQYQDALDSFLAAENAGENAKLLARGRGIAYMGLTQYEQAENSFLEALRQSDGVIENVDYDINFYLAAVYSKEEKNREAEEVYDAILALEPNNVDALFLRGNVRLKQGNYTTAKEDFDRVAELDGKNFDRLIQLYEVLDYYGYKDAGQGYLTDALQNYESQMSAYDKGRMYYYLGEYQKAYQALDEAANKGSAEAYLYLGMAYEATGDYNYAANVYNGYLTQDTGNARIYNQLGLCEMRKGEYQQALEAFQAGMKIEGNSLMQSLLFNEIVAYEYLGEYRQATVLMESYLQTYPDDAAAQREYDFLRTR